MRRNGNGFGAGYKGIEVEGSCDVCTCGAHGVALCARRVAGYLRCCCHQPVPQDGPGARERWCGEIWGGGTRRRR